VAHPCRPGARVRSLGEEAEAVSVLGGASPVVAQADRLSAPSAQVRTARLGPRRRLNNMGEPPRARELRADNGAYTIPCFRQGKALKGALAAKSVARSVGGQARADLRVGQAVDLDHLQTRLAAA